MQRTQARSLASVRRARPHLTDARCCWPAEFRQSLLGALDASSAAGTFLNTGSGQSDLFAGGLALTRSAAASRLIGRALRSAGHAYLIVTVRGTPPSVQYRRPGASASESGTISLLSASTRGVFEPGEISHTTDGPAGKGSAMIHATVPAAVATIVVTPERALNAWLAPRHRRLSDAPSGSMDTSSRCPV